jgi:hypothetical protein
MTDLSCAGWYTCYDYKKWNMTFLSFDVNDEYMNRWKDVW